MREREAREKRKWMGKLWQGYFWYCQKVLSPKMEIDDVAIEVTNGSTWSVKDTLNSQ